MNLEIENARRFNEEPLIQSVSSGDDIVLVHLANGTGVKALSLSALKAYIAGALEDLDTEDKTSLVAAINELLADIGEDRDNIGALEDLTDVFTFHGAGLHNGIYRGKYLGTSVTAAQYAEISAGTFKDLYIGDYWTIAGVNWRIAAFDYWLHCGDTECTTHHVVIVPDTNLDSQKMNDSNVTTGAYVGSKMYTEYMATAKSKVKSAFGAAHILSHKSYLNNAVTNGYESAGAWYDSEIELMTEQNVYGCKVFGNVTCGTNVPASYTIDKTQFPLFALDPSRICNRAAWWLRDVASATSFCIVFSTGACVSTDASNSYGVRPAFGIKA